MTKQEQIRELVKNMLPHKFYDDNNVIDANTSAIMSVFKDQNKVKVSKVGEFTVLNGKIGQWL